MVKKILPILPLLINTSLSWTWNYYQNSIECLKISILQQRPRLQYTVQPVRRSITDRNVSHTLPSARIAAWVNTGANGVNQKIIAMWHNSGGSVRSGNGIDKKWKFRRRVNMAISAAGEPNVIGIKDQSKRECDWSRHGERARRHSRPLTLRKRGPVECFSLDIQLVRTQGAIFCELHFTNFFRRQEMLLFPVNELPINKKKETFLNFCSTFKKLCAKIVKFWNATLCDAACVGSSLWGRVAFVTTTKSLWMIYHTRGKKKE